jgi:transcriptional regulator with XRE-family HTH domain
VASKKTTSVDVEIGSRLRLHRMLRGMTQEELGAELGLTFQQIQKYEQGLNRIPAGRLFDAARVLSVPIVFFYEGGQAVGPAYKYSGGAKPPPVMESLSNEGLLLLLAYMKVKDVDVRKRIFDSVCTIADAAKERKGRMKRAIAKPRHAA